jgi:hypothetical protein
MSHFFCAATHLPCVTYPSPEHWPSTVKGAQLSQTLMCNAMGGVKCKKAVWHWAAVLCSQSVGAKPMKGACPSLKAPLAALALMRQHVVLQKRVYVLQQT